MWDNVSIKEKQEVNFFDVKQLAVDHDVTDMINNPDKFSNALDSSNSNPNTSMNDSSNQFTKDRTGSSFMNRRRQSKDLITESINKGADKDFLRIT